MYKVKLQVAWTNCLCTFLSCSCFALLSICVSQSQHWKTTSAVCQSGTDRDISHAKNNTHYNYWQALIGHFSLFANDIYFKRYPAEVGIVWNCRNFHSYEQAAITSSLFYLFTCSVLCRLELSQPKATTVKPRYNKVVLAPKNFDISRISLIQED